MQLMLAAQALKQTPEGDRAVDSSVVVQRDVHKMIEVGSPVRSVAVQPEGTVFASGEENGAVRLWDANTGKPVRDLLAGNGGNGGDEKAVNAVAFSPDGRSAGVRQRGRLGAVVERGDRRAGRQGVERP